MGFFMPKNELSLKLASTLKIQAVLLAQSYYTQQNK